MYAGSNPAEETLYRTTSLRSSADKRSLLKAGRRSNLPRARPQSEARLISTMKRPLEPQTKGPFRLDINHDRGRLPHMQRDLYFWKRP